MHIYAKLCQLLTTFDHDGYTICLFAHVKWIKTPVYHKYVTNTGCFTFAHPWQVRM